jgi:ubiquinone biosynthesis protein
LRCSRSSVQDPHYGLYGQGPAAYVPQRPVLVLPLIFVFTALTVLVFAFGARRLLGLRFSFLRTLIAGVLAFLIASPIITAISGSVVGMVFLVVAEALVPSGSVPGLVYVLRGMRRRMGRARRYWQISGILVRRGLMPYLRGGRRSELSTSEGRARLARSVPGPWLTDSAPI